MANFITVKKDKGGIVYVNIELIYYAERTANQLILYSADYTAIHISDKADMDVVLKAIGH